MTNQIPQTQPSMGATVSRRELDTRHPEYTRRAKLWEDVHCLYEGGDLIQQQVARFLLQRPKEDGSVYQFRTDQFSYENHFGTGLGWHEAEMFVDDPVINVKLAGTDGNPSEAEVPRPVADWYTRFEGNCDRNGTTLVDMYRKVFTDLLLYSECYALVDLPARDESTVVRSLADEQAQGLLDPYVCIISPLNVINWECDEHGALKWALVKHCYTETPFMAKPVNVERWYYYDRWTYQVYESRANTGEVAVDGEDSRKATLIRSGNHPLASKSTLPLLKTRIPSGWWLGNRTYQAAKKHLNICAALDWSLYMAGMAVPVVITDGDVANLTVSESGFIHLGEGSDYKFAEPTGTCWEHLNKRANMLKEEIFRSMYLVAQSRSTSATASAQSGVSKEQDMKPSHDYLNGVGDVLQASMVKLLQLVAWARASVPGNTIDERLLFSVKGFQFSDQQTPDDVATIQDVLNLGIPSDRFEKEVHKRAVTRHLPDLDQDAKTVIFEEIDTAKNALERDLEQQQKQQEVMAKSMDAALTGGR